MVGTKVHRDRYVGSLVYRESVDLSNMIFLLFTGCKVKVFINSPTILKKMIFPVMIINTSVNINRNIIQIQLRLNFTEQRTNVIHDKVCRQLHPLQQEPFNNLE